jgi:hypothetical protein
MDGSGGLADLKISAINMNADNQMKTIFTLIIIFLVSSAGASEIKVKNVPLENGVALHIKEIQPLEKIGNLYFSSVPLSSYLFL